MRQTDNLAIWGLAALLVFVVLFWRLGEPTFWDPDEGHYAESTREMVATGDWWAPYYNEQPFFDKPVLFHQLQGAAMAAFGPTEFAARFVPALAALALVATTVWLGATVASTDVGLVAGFFLLASPGVFGLARYAILDTVFTAFVFGGAALLTVAALRDRPALQYPGYVLIAFGVLTKGPIALVLSGLTLVLVSAVSADLRRRLLGLRWVVGLMLIVATAAPWFVYMYWRFRQDFVEGYFLDENLRLFGSSRFGDQPGFGFYFQILAVGLLPWTGLLVGRLVDDVRAVVRREQLDAVEIVLWAWTVAVVGFFTASTFKLDHYVFPAAPSLCLICARAWGDVRANPGAARHAASRAGVLIIGPLLVAIGVAAGFLLIARLELPAALMAVPIALTIAGLVLIERVNMRGAPLPRVPWVVMGAMLITYTGLLLYVVPALEQRKVVDDVARWVAGQAQPGDRIASYRLNRWNPSFRFYVGRHTTFLEDPAAAAAFFSAPEPFYCVMRRDAFDGLAADGAQLQILLEREGMGATSGRALWRQRTPLTSFVVVSKPR